MRMRNKWAQCTSKSTFKVHKNELHIGCSLQPVFSEFVRVFFLLKFPCTFSLFISKLNSNLIEKTFFIKIYETTEVYSMNLYDIYTQKNK